MKKAIIAYGLGVMTGMAISMAAIAGESASQAADTIATVPQKASEKIHGGLAVQTGVVADGEQVPLPQDVDTATIHIFLAIREIQDNNEILGRVECFLEADGRTAHVRNVNKFTGEVVSTGTANYAVFYER